MAKEKHGRLGIIGGLGALAGADILFKIVKASSLQDTNRKIDILFEQEPFDDRNLDKTGVPRLTERKLYVYRVVRELEARNVDTVVLPCFISHTFLHEIAPELSAQVVYIMAALSAHIRLIIRPSASSVSLHRNMFGSAGCLNPAPVLKAIRFCTQTAKYKSPGCTKPFMAHAGSRRDI